MKIAIVYHSAGGNTKALAEIIASHLPNSDLFRVTDFHIKQLANYDGLLIGTYTWGNGDLPARVIPFYEELETSNISNLVTGIFGTGETNYQHFCGAVDIFRNMLFVRSVLAVTLKIEQMYQESDLSRIKHFVQLFETKLTKCSM